MLFFACGSLVALFVGARLTNTETYEWSNRLCSSAPAWRDRPPTNDEMRRARYYAFGKDLQDSLAVMKDAIEDWPMSIKNVLIWTYIQVAQPVLDTTETRRLAWVVGAFNGLLYFMWQSPRTRLLMQTHFMHSPLSGRSYTMLTSLFSHRRFVHLWLCSAAAAAFGSAAAQYLFEERNHDPDNLREATPKWHFLAFFISAGLFSNLVSHVAASRISFPRLVARLRSSAASAPHPSSSAAASKPKAGFFARLRLKRTASPEDIPSFVGASGAVYSAFTVVALAYPDTDLALKIPPTFPLSIEWGLGMLLALDVIGVLRGWRLFNHWAHLGGAAFGAFYWEYGPFIWEVCRLLTLGSLPPILCDVPDEQEEQ